MKVSDILLSGKDNAIPGPELVKLLRLSNRRELTQMVERERRAGLPICATPNSRNGGYYLADSPEELEQYINALDRRIHQVTVTRLHCEETLYKMRGD